MCLRVACSSCDKPHAAGCYSDITLEISEAKLMQPLSIYVHSVAAFSCALSCFQISLHQCTLKELEIVLFIVN